MRVFACLFIVNYCFIGCLEVDKSKSSENTSLRIKSFVTLGIADAHTK